MGEFYDEIPDDEKLIEWIKNQKLFHVASAPLNGGHVNVSPRGYQTFKLVNRKACWFLAQGGNPSFWRGNETISHLYQPGNGRITILFEAFEGPPRIMRIYGIGKVYEHGTPEFDKFFEPPEEPDLYDFPIPERLPGARAVIWIDITRVGTACGYSVPFMQFIGHREQLNQEAKKMEVRDAALEDPYELPWNRGLKKYWVTINTWSIDGLPGLKRNLDKITPQGMRDAMHHAGLKNLEPPAGVFEKATTKGTKVQEIYMLVVGLVLGALIMNVVHHRLGGTSPNLEL